ncbi:hypothetical protein FACS1894188_09180 [Clostridia bacterium]|nr:hypothetical protein FACS1894188_09180 [Clostridia bacterium]
MDELRIIIVTGDGYESEYAAKLNALLSEKGIKAVLWTEAQYLSNRPTLPNKERLIFFGLGAETKKQAEIVKDWVFDSYACRIGWIGNTCVITAWDWDLSWDGLEDFSRYCKSKAEKHLDIVIPAGKSLDEVLSVVKGVFTDKNNTSVWHAQYSLLAYEFIDNWIVCYARF